MTSTKSVITALTVMALALCLGGFVFTDDYSATDPEPEPTYLTVVYAGIIDPADIEAIGPASAQFVADVVAEPATYIEGKAFDVLLPYIVGTKATITLEQYEDMSASEKSSLMTAVEKFCDNVYTELKFVADADKLIVLVNSEDVEAAIEAIIALMEEASAQYEAKIAELEAIIEGAEGMIFTQADIDKAIADTKALYNGYKSPAEVDAMIAAAVAEAIADQPVKQDDSVMWMCIAAFFIFATIVIAVVLALAFKRAKTGGYRLI